MWPGGVTQEPPRSTNWLDMNFAVVLADRSLAEAQALARMRQPSFHGSEVKLCPPPPSGGASARKLPLRADEVAGVAIRVAFQVVLVLGLGLPEVASGRNFRHHLARPQP